MTFLRKSGARDSGRAHDPTRPQPTTGPARLAGRDIDDFRSSVESWLDDNQRVLAPDYQGTGTLDEQMAQLAKVKRLAYDAGFMRMGWPERVGGLGGRP
jgi:alkylation response protein AidB-like acyl-CoA dehydrogenase